MHHLFNCTLFECLLFKCRCSIVVPFILFPEKRFLFDVKVSIVVDVLEIRPTPDRNRKPDSIFSRAVCVHVLHVVSHVIFLVIFLKKKLFLCLGWGLIWLVNRSRTLDTGQAWAIISIYFLASFKYLQSKIFKCGILFEHHFLNVFKSAGKLNLCYIQGV